MKKRHKLLREIHAEVRALGKEESEAVRRQYPIGCTVEWEHGRHTRIGEVIEYGYSTDVFVRTSHSERQRIDALRFLGDGTVRP